MSHNLENLTEEELYYLMDGLGYYEQALSRAVDTSPNMTSKMKHHISVKLEKLQKLARKIQNTLDNSQ